MELEPFLEGDHDNAAKKRVNSLSDVKNEVAYDTPVHHTVQGCSGIEKKDPGSIFLLRPILLD